jgi:holo-[acyl-carrier protein] synthase
VTALARSSALGLVAGIGSAAGVVGVGVDAVDLGRFARVLGRRERLADRLFTEGELAYARAASDPVPRFATRFAAKEAVMKSLGVGLGAFPFHDVEVVRVGLDAPGLVLRGAAHSLAARAGVSRWHLSLSHTGEVAVALVVAEGAAGLPAVTTGPRPTS